MNRRSLLGGFAGAATLVAMPAISMPASAQGRMQMEKLKLRVLMGGDFSTETSKLAVRRSRNSLVTTFAELEIEEQAAVAEAYGSRPGRAGVRPDQAEMIEELSALRGAAFDAMYVEGQIKGHRELLKANRSYASSGADPMARGGATVAIPAIQTHLAMLQSLRKSMG